MDCLEALKTRRSVRSFAAEPVPREHLMEMIDAGRLAASAGNCQPWEFLVIDDRETIKKLKSAAFDQPHFDTAPAVIVVCAEPSRSSQYGERGMNYYCFLDCAAATQNILLAAHALGYGACWMGGFKEKEVRRVLNIPEQYRVVALVPVGKPYGEQWKAPKRDLSEILHWGQW